MWIAKVAPVYLDINRTCKFCDLPASFQFIVKYDEAFNEKVDGFDLCSAHAAQVEDLLDKDMESIVPAIYDEIRAGQIDPRRI